MTRIHPSAVVDPQAELAGDVEVGPLAVIDGPVRIAAGTRVLAQAHLCGHTEIGPHCVIHPFAAIGGLPQDVAHTGERSFVRVGARTVIREGVTIHRGTTPESVTAVGSDCMLMANSHVAHNCRVGDHVVLVNGVLLAGHVQVGDHAVLGGSCGVHQFCRIGEFTMIGGLTAITQDAAPFMSYINRSECIGVNRVGLRRNGFSRAAITELAELHHELFRSRRSLRSAAEECATRVKTDAGKRLLEFVRADSRRGIAGVGQ
jgi:UDP-N-acetylglucosamine acyltransferase